MNLQEQLTLQRREPLPVLEYGDAVRKLPYEALSCLGLFDGFASRVRGADADLEAMFERDALNTYYTLEALQPRNVESVFGFVWLYRDAFWFGVHIRHPFNDLRGDASAVAALRLRCHQNRIRPGVEASGGLTRTSGTWSSSYGRGVRYGYHVLEAMWPKSVVDDNCKSGKGFHDWAHALVNKGGG